MSSPGGLDKAVSTEMLVRVVEHSHERLPLIALVHNV